MILDTQQIKEIIFKSPRKLRNKLNGEEINEYSYSYKEQLNLVQTFIKQVKGVDVGEISPPKGTINGAFVDMCVRRGINPMLAVQRGSDLDSLEFAFNVCLNYYINKYKENGI